MFMCVMPVTRAQAKNENRQAISLTTLKAQIKRKLRTFLNTLDIQFEKKEKHFRNQFQIYMKSVEHLYHNRIFCDTDSIKIARGHKPFVPLFDSLITPRRKSNTRQIETSLSKHLKLSGFANATLFFLKIRKFILVSSVSALSMVNRKIGHRQSRLGQPKTQLSCQMQNGIEFGKQTLTRVKEQIITGKVILDGGKIMKFSEPALVLYKLQSGKYAIAASHEESDVVLGSGVIEGSKNVALDHIRRIIGDK
ncbi:hypothetical protein ACOME3_003757 [Neoechinorhynchus agilis]